MLAAEWQNENLDINAIAPGAIFTRMLEEILARGEKLSGKKEFESVSKMPRDNSEKLQKVSGLVQMLLSPACDGISGKLISAPWDPWQKLPALREELMKSDIYTLRRIVPEDRGKKF